MVSQHRTHCKKARIVNLRKALGVACKRNIHDEKIKEHTRSSFACLGNLVWNCLTNLTLGSWTTAQMNHFKPPPKHSKPLQLISMILDLCTMVVHTKYMNLKRMRQTSTSVSYHIARLPLFNVHKKSFNLFQICPVYVIVCLSVTPIVLTHAHVLFCNGVS